jgi:hypothetical protein
MQIPTAITTARLLTHLIILLCIAESVPAQSVFREDLTLNETTTSTGIMGQGQRNTTTTNYFSKNVIKHSSSDGTDTIIYLDQGKIVSIDNKNKTYTEITVQQLNELFAKMSAEMSKNAEQAEAVRKMIGQTAAVSVIKQGPGETIAGYATEKYLVTGPLQMEIWAAPELKVPALYYDAIKMSIPRNPIFDVGTMYDEMKKISGITLKSVTTMKMLDVEIKTTSIVTSVKKGTIPASMFAVPSDYKLVSTKPD